MTETITRRGIRFLLALLLTGMALLMMGAVRPVMAAVPSASISLDTKGWVTAPDHVSWTAGLTYSGPSGSVAMDYYVDCTITYFSGSTSVGTSVIHNVTPQSTTAGSPVNTSADFDCAAGQYGLAVMNAVPGITGFRWSYTLVVEAVNDENSNVGNATAVSDEQSYGQFTAPPSDGGGGTSV